MKRWLQRVFGIDLRSLAALRIGATAVALCDLAVRARDLPIHYTDFGALARQDVLAWFDNRHALAVSLHLLGGSVWSQALLFGIEAIALLAMLVGWRTRIATAVAWLLMLSMHLRNPFVVYGADVLMRSVLLWGALLPLGARWSLDAALASGDEPLPSPNEKGDDSKPGRAQPRTIVGVAATGLQLQVFTVMFIAGAAKLASSTWATGQGLGTALDHEFHTRPLGFWLQQHAALTSALSYVVMALEAGGAFLLFTPWWRVRMPVIVAMWAMLAGIALTMRVGFFAPMTAVALLAFVPGEVWDRLERLAARIPMPQGVQRCGNAAYWREIVMYIRARTGMRLATSTARAHRGWRRFAAELFASLLIAYTAVWNVGFWYDRDYEPPAGLAELGSILFLWQQWGMFTSIDSTGWFVIPGSLRDGRSIDLMANRGRLPTLEQTVSHPLTYDKPADVAQTLPNIHWQSMFATMVLVPDQAGPFQYYARYLCREWNRTHSGQDQLLRVQIIRMTRSTQPQASPHPAGDYERRVLWSHDCG